MKIAHMSDLHYCLKHLKNVQAAFSFAVTKAIADRAECAVISGDEFDSLIYAHDPSVLALMGEIQRLANEMPVLILQGTFSHDRPGSLDVLGKIGANNPIYIADKAEQIGLCCDVIDNEYSWVQDNIVTEDTQQVVAVFSCLPSLNKASPEVTEAGSPAEYVEKMCDLWAFENKTVYHSVPKIMVTHGTIIGCTTESRFAMISPDHEFNLPVLYSSECDAVMIGHIHRHQTWTNGRQVIAYPGSITRLVFGHNDPVGFIMWDVIPLEVGFEFIPTPAPRLIDIDFPAEPDMDELIGFAEKATADDHVRIIYRIDQEHAHSVDRDAIDKLFEHVLVLKVEPIISAVQSIRAKGIGTAFSLEEKMGYWATTTGDEDKIPELTNRLHELKSADVDDIIERLTE